MKATLFSLFVALLMVGCGKEETAFERTKRLAEGGDKVAQCLLAYIYSEGKGVPEDDKEAVKWYTKAAKQGNAKAQNNLGEMYYNAEGVPQDYKEAVKWYRLAAEQGDANAQAMVGLCYADGLGVAKNLIEGYAWYNIAIANGQEDAKEWIKEIELSPEQLIEAQSLSTEIHKRIEANKKEQERKEQERLTLVRLEPHNILVKP